MHSLQQGRMLSFLVSVPCVRVRVCMCVCVSHLVTRGFNSCQCAVVASPTKRAIAVKDKLLCAYRYISLVAIRISHNLASRIEPHVILDIEISHSLALYRYPQISFDILMSL